MFHAQIAGVFTCTLVALVAFGNASAQELTLDEAQRLAETGQPQLAAQRSAIEAAGEAAQAARELPDPKLRLGVLNVPIEGNDALSLGAEPMTMSVVGVMQAFPRRDKRELRGQVFNLSGARSARELDYLRLQMRRDAALAWLDAWTAARALDLIVRQQQELQFEIDRLAIALRNNRVAASEVSKARVAMELLRDREHAQRGAQHGARARLARWLGTRAHAPLPVSLPELPRPLGTDVLADRVESHPRLATVDMQARIADAEARLANLATRPDWSMELAYGRRGSQFGDMVSVQFQIDLPIFQERRQNRSVAAKLAQAQQMRELREDDLRRMRADALQLNALWETANARVRAFEQRILPEAQNRVQAAIVSYRGGKGELSEVLAARRALLELELEALMRRVEVAGLAIRLEYFNPTGEQR